MTFATGARQFVVPTPLKTWAVAGVKAEAGVAGFGGGGGVTIPASAVGGNHLGAHIVPGADDFADRAVVFQHFFFAADAFFGHQRRVGRDAVEDTEFGGFLDVVQVGSINKKQHNRLKMGEWEEMGEWENGRMCE